MEIGAQQKRRPEEMRAPNTTNFLWVLEVTRKYDSSKIRRVIRAGDRELGNKQQMSTVVEVMGVDKEGQRKPRVSLRKELHTVITIKSTRREQCAGAQGSRLVREIMGAQQYLWATERSNKTTENNPLALKISWLLVTFIRQILTTVR